MQAQQRRHTHQRRSTQRNETCTPFCPNPHTAYAPHRRHHRRAAGNMPTAAAAAAAAAGAGTPAAAASTDTAAAFKRLQNGSDIRGVAMQADPSHVVTLTPAAVFYIGRAFVRFLLEKQRSGSGGDGNNSGGGSITVAIGSDPRLSAALLRGALVAGLAEQGANVVDGGLATTPAMFYSIVAPGSKVTGAIMLTASHMPLQNNGAGGNVMRARARLFF
jgi:hypothetical protein